MNYLIVLLILFFTVIFAFHLNNLLFFSIFISYASNLFATYTNYFYSIPLVLNAIRTSVVSKVSTSSSLLTFLTLMTDYTDQLSKIKENKKFHFFPKTQNLWKELSQDVENVNTTMICLGNSLCLRYLQNSNGYCAKGVYLATQLVVQKFVEVVSDYTNLSKKGFSDRDLKKFLKKKDFSSIVGNVDFIFNQVQTIMYQCFASDYTGVKNMLLKNVLLINFLLIAIEITGCILVYIMLLIFERKIVKAQFGANKCTIAFNKRYQL